MTSRPEYVVCVATGMEDGPERGISWCGRSVKGEFHIKDARHASLEARQEGRLLLCPDCALAIVTAIAGQAWNGRKP